MAGEIPVCSARGAIGAGVRLVRDCTFPTDGVRETEEDIFEEVEVEEDLTEEMEEVEEAGALLVEP